MTRRLLASLTLATVFVGGLGAFTAASATDDDHWVCIGGEAERKPGYYKLLCLDNVPGESTLKSIIKIEQ